MSTSSLLIYSCNWTEKGLHLMKLYVTVHPILWFLGGFDCFLCKHSFEEIIIHWPLLSYEIFKHTDTVIYHITCMYESSLVLALATRFSLRFGYAKMKWKRSGGGGDQTTMIHCIGVGTQGCWFNSTPTFNLPLTFLYSKHNSKWKLTLLHSDPSPSNLHQM